MPGISDDTPAIKATLRRTLRQRRRAVPERHAREAARLCADTLIHSSFWRHSAHIALYLPHDGEMDTQPIAGLARANGRRLYLPRILGEKLEFADWIEGQALRVNDFKLAEPTGPARPLQSMDLMIVPLVGFSPQGMRLGMGGGYYDRSLGALNPVQRPHLLGLAYTRQCVEELPEEAWDIPLDGVLCEKGLLEFASRRPRKGA